jgi:hypothetical protein
MINDSIEEMGFEISFHCLCFREFIVLDKFFLGYLHLFDVYYTKYLIVIHDYNYNKL